MTDTAVDELTRVCADAVRSMLEQFGNLTGAVFDGRVTGNRPQRYVMFTLSRLIGSGRLTGQDTQADWLLVLTSVGTTVDQARWVQAAGIRALLDARIQLPGWSSTPIRHTDSQPIDWDATAVPELAYAVDSFRWKSDKQ